MEGNKKYQNVIRGLLYVAVNTRPDIAAVVSILSQRITNPSRKDWTEIKRVLKYLKGTVNHKLKFGEQQEEHGLKLVGFVDVDWAQEK